MPEAAPQRILALIPAYNEGSRVRKVVERTREHLPVLVVDDGSADDTGAHAHEAGATVVRQEPNRGKGAALRRGFDYALSAGCEAVITLDADGQHDPAEIPVFLAKHRARNSDLIIGYRDFSRMPFVRRLSNTVARRTFSWAMGREILDNQSGYRLIGRRLMEAMAQSAEAGFEFEVEMIAVCVERGLRLDWVSIRTIYAGEGSHIQPWKHAREFFRVVVQTRRRMHRRRSG